MSAGVRARELAFVNGDREFAARAVIDERTVGSGTKRELFCY